MQRTTSKCQNTFNSQQNLNFNTYHRAIMYGTVISVNNMRILAWKLVFWNNRPGDLFKMLYIYIWNFPNEFESKSKNMHIFVCGQTFHGIHREPINEKPSWKWNGFVVLQMELMYFCWFSKKINASLTSWNKDSPAVFLEWSTSILGKMRIRMKILSKIWYKYMYTIICNIILLPSAESLPRLLNNIKIVWWTEKKNYVINKLIMMKYLYIHTH